MAVLTLSQKETIAAIERQFIAANETNTDIPYSVVNINKLNVEVNRQKVARNELSIHNEAMKKVRYELRDKLIVKLNADFEAGNIQLTAVVYGYDVKICLTKDLKAYNSDAVVIHINEVEERAEFGAKIIGFEYSNNTKGVTGAEVAKTAEELFTTERLEKSMVYIMDKANK